jgi:hypothetical protein
VTSWQPLIGRQLPRCPVILNYRVCAVLFSNHKSRHEGAGSLLVWRTSYS